MKRRNIIFALVSLMFIGACLGTGKLKEESTTASLSDALPGRFVRELGPTTVETLLRNPFLTGTPGTATGPGMPVNEMLYLISQVSEDKMIDVVKGVGADRTLSLFYSIKRLGCNRGNPALAIDNTNLNTGGCTLDNFNYLEKMGQLINGTNSTAQLVSLVNQCGLLAELPTPPESDADTFNCNDSTVASNQRIAERPLSPFINYLERMAFLVVYLDDTAKLTQLVNGVTDSRDTVHMIDQLDPGMSAPTLAGQEINEMTDTYRLIGIMQNITDATKLYRMINGTRTAAGTAEDTNQIRYIDDRLLPVLKGFFAVLKSARVDTTAAVGAGANSLSLTSISPSQSLQNGDIFIIENVTNPAPYDGTLYTVTSAPTYPTYPTEDTINISPNLNVALAMNDNVVLKVLRTATCGACGGATATFTNVTPPHSLRTNDIVVINNQTHRINLTSATWNATYDQVSNVSVTPNAAAFGGSITFTQSSSRRNARVNGAYAIAQTNIIARDVSPPRSIVGHATAGDVVQIGTSYHTVTATVWTSDTDVTLTISPGLVTAAADGDAITVLHSATSGNNFVAGASSIDLANVIPNDTIKDGYTMAHGGTTYTLTGGTWNAARTTLTGVNIAPNLATNLNVNDIVTISPTAVSEDDFYLTKVYTLVNQITNIDNMVSLMNGVALSSVNRIIDLIISINPPDLPAPDHTAVLTMGYLVDNIGTINNLITLVDGITDIQNLATLTNQVASGSQLDDGGGTDLTAAGQKMVGVIDNVTDINNVIFLIENISNITKMGDLINRLRIASTTKMANLVNEVDSDSNGLTNCQANAGNWVTTNGTFANGNCSNAAFNNDLTGCMNDNSTWSCAGVGGRACYSVNTCVGDATLAGDYAGCIGGGNTWQAGDMCKLINMIDYTDDTGPPSMYNMAQLLDTIGESSKLSGLVNSAPNSSNLVGLINAAINLKTADVNGVFAAGTSNNILLQNLSPIRSLSTGDEISLNGTVYTITVNSYGSDTDVDINVSPALVVTANNTDPVKGSIVPAMAGLLDRLDGSANTFGNGNQIPKMATIVNSLGNATEGALTTTAHADHTLIAELLLPQNSTPAKGTGGVGPAVMAQLLYQLNDVAAANNAATLLTGLNANLSIGVGGPCTATPIPKKEALVRMLIQDNTNGGFDYCVTGTAYPGLGPTYISDMANLATGMTIPNMVTLMNNATTDIAEVIPLAGCGDKAGDTTGNGVFDAADTPFTAYNGGTFTGEGDVNQPDFQTPCTADGPTTGFTW